MTRPSKDFRWEKVQAGYYVLTNYENGRSTMAKAVLTGRPGVDDYPWDWSIDWNNESGVEATLRDAKARVEFFMWPELNRV